MFINSSFGLLIHMLNTKLVLELFNTKFETPLY